METSVNRHVLVKMEHLVMVSLEHVYVHLVGKVICVKCHVRLVMVVLGVTLPVLLTVEMDSVVRQLDLVYAQHLVQNVNVLLVTMVVHVKLLVTVSMERVTRQRESVFVLMVGF